MEYILTPRPISGESIAVHPDIEVEELDLNTRYNDFIITGLRTMWGVSLVEIQRQFGKRNLPTVKSRQPLYLKQGLLIQKGRNFTPFQGRDFYLRWYHERPLWV